MPEVKVVVNSNCQYPLSYEHATGCSPGTMLEDELTHGKYMVVANHGNYHCRNENILVKLSPGYPRTIPKDTGDKFRIIPGNVTLTIDQN
jgi:hypothetical protein